MADNLVPAILNAFAETATAINEVRRNFEIVDDILRDEPSLRQISGLQRTWDALYRDFNVALRDSKDDARRCAGFLRDYSAVLVSLASPESTRSTWERENVIRVFLNDIHRHTEKATETEAKFDQLADRVKDFPHTVRQAIEDNEPRIWESIWNKIKSFCSWIAAQVIQLISALAIFVATKVMSGTRHAVVTAGSYYILLETVRRGSRDPGNGNVPEGPEAACRRIRQKCDAIEENMSTLGLIWACVENSCTTLINSYQRAEGLVNFPELYNAVAMANTPVFDAIIPSLEAYANERPPTVAMDIAPVD